MKNRKDIEPKYKWDLESIIDGNENWDICFSSCSEQIGEVDSFKGKLHSDEVLLDCLRKQEQSEINLMKLLLYAKMHHDEDTADGKYQKMLGKIENLLQRYQVATSYITPEICQRSAEELVALSKNADFSDYSYMFKQLAKSKERVLGEKEEALLSDMGSFANEFENAFSLFDNADVVFKPIKDENGKKGEMSHSLFSKYLQSPSRRVRRAAFDSMFSAYAAHNNTLAAIYGGNVKATWFRAKTRKFNSCLEYKTYYEDVPMKVYENLISAVHSGIPALNKYLQLRRKLLGIRELRCYDLYVPMFTETDEEYEYEQAYDIVKKALLPLGNDYQDLLNDAHDNGWIDVYETKNKRSGAYSWGMAGIPHPFVCLNFNGTIHDVFTIAHELGHAMHTHFSAASQPYAKSDYVIFVAEVASTVNEVLLLKYLLSTETDKKRRDHLLGYYLEMFRTTVFRQTMFAEFEEKAHALAEQNEPIIAETLNEIYFDLNKQYYPAVNLNDEIKYEWSRIPHFYSDFYVYKYATGLLSAVYIATEILKGNKAVSDGYRKFLCAGGSMPPCDILRLAGVDLENPETMKNSIGEFEKAVRELTADNV